VSSAGTSSLATRERAFVAGLCVLAGIRIFLFSAAFPFMNNVDEAAHFDVVYKYAFGKIPGAMERYSTESSRIIALFGVLDYLRRPEEFGLPSFPPGLWSDPSSEAMRAVVEDKIRDRTERPNLESGQAPLYYIVAGGWYRLGRALGLSEGMALYWIRFLNVPVYMSLVVLAYAFLRRRFPEHGWLALGVPMLLVVFPQDVFYSINNDVPGAVLFAAAFFMGMEILVGETAGPKYHGAAGLLAAAAVLVKLSNLSILAVMAGVVALRWRRSLQDRADLGPVRRRLILLMACAVLPVLAWGLRNAIVLSDVTGQAAKFAALGWTLRSPWTWWHHPVFTPAGAGVFVWELVASFWRGELYWHNARLSWAGSDAFYVATSLLFLALSAIALGRGASDQNRGERAVQAFGFIAVAVSLLPLLLISIAYDFGASFYPSRKHPFMSSGRLMIGTLIPFLTLYLTGLDRLLSWAGARVNRLAVAAVISAAILLSEILLSVDVFRSANNWFHILGHRGGP
jgi:hypothetical protein